MFFILSKRNKEWSLSFFLYNRWKISSYTISKPLLDPFLYRLNILKKWYPFFDLIGPTTSSLLLKIKELNWSEVLPFFTVLDSNKKSETFMSVFLFKMKKDFSFFEKEGFSSSGSFCVGSGSFNLFVARGIFCTSSRSEEIIIS